MRRLLRVPDAAATCERLAGIDGGLSALAHRLDLSFYGAPFSIHADDEALRAFGENVGIGMTEEQSADDLARAGDHRAATGSAGTGELENPSHGPVTTGAPPQQLHQRPGRRQRVHAAFELVDGLERRCVASLA